MLLLSRGIDTPFNGWHELNSAMYSQFARNHIQYGLGYTALYCTWGDTLLPPEKPERYLNHPPLIALWTAGALALFGDHEWSARLVPIASTLGSTYLLMTILSRLGGSLLGALAGFFFATLPLTAYFGRMLDHVAPVQFFSLLMIHGYLEWSGTYGGPGQRRTGASCYTVGALLGIGTGWGALPAAGLIWAWHAWRVARGAGSARLLVWLAALPTLALGAVVAHIGAAVGWDFGMLEALFASRSLGGVGGEQASSAWLARQWLYAARNFTMPGLLAAVLCLPFLATNLVRTRREGAPVVPLTGDLGAVVALCGLHGILYVALFKNAAWFHDYWQFFLGPFVAASEAALLLALREVLGAVAPRLPGLAVLALLAAPLPGLASSLAFYGAVTLKDPEYIEALTKLGEMVPWRAPVWTSRPAEEGSETIGRQKHRWPDPTIAYYANRPLHFSRNAREVEANTPGCAAYLLRRSRREWTREIELALSARFRRVEVGDHHAIFLLNEPSARRGLGPEHLAVLGSTAWLETRR